jgi:hypothetical protein
MAVLAVTLASGSARSEEAREPAARCSPEASATPQTRDQEIAALYGAFECHFSRQEFAACLPFLEQACSLTHSPRCFLNLGAVHHALMHCELARGYYQEYLNRVPYDEEGQDARKALEELSVACPVEETAPAVSPESGALTPSVSLAGAGTEPAGSAAAHGGSPAAAPPLQSSDAAQAASVEVGGDAASRDERGTQRVVAWSLLGAGAVSAVWMGLAASYGARAANDFDARYEASGGVSIANDPELQAIDARGAQYDELAVTFGVTSAVLFGAAAAFWWLDFGLDADVDVSGGGSAQLRYGGSF